MIMKQKLLSIILLAAGCLSASAQQADNNEKEEFQAHWYGQAQIGMQHTLGEISFGSLNSFNAQIAAGYQFSELWGARLTIGGFQSKGGLDLRKNEYDYSWNYIAPTVNATFNVTNAIFGYNPDRIVDFSLLAGAGANIAWGNGEANDLNKNLKAEYGIPATDADLMGYLWDGTKARLVGQFGGMVDFKICKNMTAGIEFTANFLGDQYNSKRTRNVDWYFNALAGIKVNL